MVLKVPFLYRLQFWYWDFLRTLHDSKKATIFQIYLYLGSIVCHIYVFLEHAAATCPF